VSEACSSFLVLRGEQVDWGVPSEAVVRLATPGEVESVDVLAALGFRARALQAASPRAVVLRARGGELALRVDAPLAFEDVETAALCPLPALVFGGRPTVFRQVVFREVGRALLVLDPESLRARVQSAEPAAPEAAAAAHGG